MKTTKIIYWIVTVLFGGIFTITGTLYLIHQPGMVHKLTALGYPLYVLDIIGTAKLLGVIALLQPKSARLKEWAYAGFAIDFIGGCWSHFVVEGAAKAAPLLVPSALLVVSYVLWRRIQSNPTWKLTPRPKSSNTPGIISPEMEEN